MVFNNAVFIGDTIDEETEKNLKSQMVGGYLEDVELNLGPKKG